MLRQFLLGLARISWMKQLVIQFPPARRVARRFVAGEHLADALEVTRNLTAKGLKVTLDLLGENVYDEQAANKQQNLTWKSYGPSRTRGWKVTFL